MRYRDFEYVISTERMQKYLDACGGDSRRAMTLYRYNLRLSQEMFTMVSCFEVTLRNAIDRRLKAELGAEWLRDLILPGGRFFYDQRVGKTRKIIDKAYQELMRKRCYTHTQLLTDMEFGVWKYMFSNVQYQLTNQVPLDIFPNKPTSTPRANYDNTYVFGELNFINKLRNRIAHHEPICFNNTGAIDTSYALNRYTRMLTLFQWMDVDGPSLLFGLDHVGAVCSKIMCV